MWASGRLGGIGLVIGRRGSGIFGGGVDNNRQDEVRYDEVVG